MRLIKAALLLLSIFIMSFSCSKGDDAYVEPYVVPYAEQYAKDIVDIDKFLDSYKMTNSADFQNVTFTPLSSPIDVSQTIRVEHASKLKFKTVTTNGVDYKVYYIEFNEGIKDKPTTLDSTFVNYKGMLLNKKSGYVDADGFEKNQIFDEAKTPVWFTLSNVIEGWKRIISLFKSGDSVPGANNNTVYSDFGAGVMFLPSGLAYYNVAQVKIPAYSPLIFTFSLKSVNYVDHDYDWIDSRYEGYDEATGKYTLDTDGDGILNYLDQDDDGDGRFTKYEIKRPSTRRYTSFPPPPAPNDFERDGNGNPVYFYSGYYKFDVSTGAVDDPITPDLDESKGVPDCSGNGSNPLRIRKHLDKNCK